MIAFIYLKNQTAPASLMSIQWKQEANIQPRQAQYRASIGVQVPGNNNDLSNEIKATF